MSEKVPGLRPGMLIFALIYVLIFPALLLLLSGDWRWVEGWIFTVWFVALCYTTILYIYRKDPALLAEVALVLGQCRFDVVHFNNGLHGWGFTEEEYQKAFPALVATIRKHAPQAKLIWATITPMRRAGKLDVIAEGTKRVEARNKIAEEIVAREGIAVDDLYGLVKDYPEYWSPDGVHFNAQGVGAQVKQVTKKITECLE